MLVHGRVAPGIKVAGTHSYTWVERGPGTEHNVLGQGLNPKPLNPESERTNHEATAIPTGGVGVTS